MKKNVKGLVTALAIWMAGCAVAQPPSTGVEQSQLDDYGPQAICSATYQCSGTGQRFTERSFFTLEQAVALAFDDCDAACGSGGCTLISQNASCQE